MSNGVHVQETGFQLTDRIVADYLNTAGKYELLAAEEEVEKAQIIEQGERAKELLNTDEELSEDVITHLETVVEQGREAWNEFFLANLRLVVYEAKRFQGRGLEFEDLISEGNLGLARGIDGFDWRRGFRFSSYGGYWIRQALGAAVADKGYTIKMPEPVRRTVNEIKLAVGKSRAKHLTQEILDEAGIEMSLEDAAHLLAVAETTSFDAPVGDEGSSSLVDHLDELATAGDSVEADVVTMHFATLINEALNRLPEKHKVGAKAAFVVQRRYGTDGQPQESLAEVAVHLDMSKQGVQHLERLGLRLLREELSALASEYGVVEESDELEAAAV